jgi:hypothetical protein
MTIAPTRQRIVTPETAPKTYIHPHTLTVLGTYKCTAMCDNCCFGSNPRITQRLGLNEILSFIEEGSNYSSMQLVVFSGGECFLLGEDLVRAVEFASNKGLRTRCVTNGYWAKTLSHGRKRLQQLKNAGLSELNISTGDYHQQYVALETVINAAYLGVELELDYTLIMVELQKERKFTIMDLLENPRIQTLAKNQGTAPFKIIESPWMPMNAEERINQPPDRLLNRENVHLRKGCNSVLSTIVVTPTKKLGLCCGLSRELIPELNADWNEGLLPELLEQAGNDFIKIWLFVDGPERMLAWAASKNPQIDWEGRYAHHCHACLAVFDNPLVRQTIAENYRERVNDVLMRYSVLLREQELLEGTVYG